ncbi:12353_t:CDS:2 [Racocetra fulgida]|uniref:12353_t:CDS:1 n=1 Tax=Racocetra fulgida TaxID=60492 RepID=A0A9N9HXQ6_9GLOM|nr:12353_t:CDS:2 [Racocetra fulgida]
MTEQDQITALAISTILGVIGNIFVNNKKPSTDYLKASVRDVNETGERLSISMTYKDEGTVPVMTPFKCSFSRDFSFSSPH